MTYQTKFNPSNSYNDWIQSEMYNLWYLNTSQQNT